MKNKQSNNGKNFILFLWIYDNSYHQIIDFRIWSQLIEEQAQNKNKVRRMDFK